MTGCTVAEFVDDLLTMGGPEKEFVFRNRFFFLETLYREEKDMLELYLDEYDNTNPKDKIHLQRHSFWGHNFAECVAQFEKAKIFDGMTFYEADQELVGLYG